MLPDHFTGVRNALLIAFERSHLIVFPSWRAALGPTLRAVPGAGIYALFVAGDKSGWRRRMIEIGLRMETLDAHAMEHTAVLYRDVAQWCLEAGLAQAPEVPVVAICDAQGRVFATTEGDQDEIRTARLAACLKL